MFKRLTQRVMHICMAVVLLFAFVLIAPGAQIARAEGNNYTLAAQGDCTAFLAAIGGNGFERSDFYGDQGECFIQSGTLPVGDTLTVSEGWTLRPQDSPGFTNQGTIIITSSAVYYGAGIFNNEGTINFDGQFPGVPNQNYGTINNSGIINIAAGVTLGNYDYGSITNQNTGAINISGTLNNRHTLVNEGIIVNEGTINNADTLINRPVNNSCGSLTGSGTLTGNDPVDACPPGVTVNQATGQADPTGSDPVVFTADFSEPVSGFTKDDVTWSGTAAPDGQYVTVIGGPSSYTISVFGLHATGTLMVSLAANVATDTAGNGNSASTSTDNTVVFDHTPPHIYASVDGTFGSGNWYVDNVRVRWHINEGDTDVTSQSGCTMQNITSDTSGITLTCSATSAGGTSSESVTIQRDATAPTVSPVVSPNPILLNGAATVTPGAADALSGIASQSCGALDTSSIGTKSVSCTATDNAGNTVSASVSYSVIYSSSSFSSPVDNNGVLNVAKAGQAIPLKFRVTDANGVPVTNLTSVSVTVAGLSCSVATSADTVEEYVSDGSGLKNLGHGYYQWNWKTPKTYADSCKALKLSLGDGTGYELTALFQFKK